MSLAPVRSVDPLPQDAAALAHFVEAGIFDAYEVHLVATMARLDPTIDEEVRLALALAARSPRFGHVCTRLDITSLPMAVGDGDGPSAASLRWPDPESWERTLRQSSLVADADGGERLPLRPLVWDLDRLYLQRLWHDEMQVASELRRRCQGDDESAAADVARRDEASVDGILDLLFERRDGAGDESVADGLAPDGPRADRQRLATQRGLHHRISIIAGGPGTGKTYTVARLLAATHLAAGDDGRRPSVALAAPTGKAANRMSEAVAGAIGTLAYQGVIGEALAEDLAGTPALTLHRLLGARGDATYFHDGHHPLPYDLVIVDETSMVSLSLLAALVAGLRPEARLVLVGDPSQLTSIEAGTVMSDLVGPVAGDGMPAEDAAAAAAAGGPSLDRTRVNDGVLDGRVTVLDRVKRYGEDSGIASLAGAIRRGDVDETIDILASGASDVRWVHHDDIGGLESIRAEVVADGAAMVAAARSGDAAATIDLAIRTKVLCAVRRGPFGRGAWGDFIRSSVLEQTSSRGWRRWYLGRPIMVTANDAVNRLFNGDVGVAVDHEGRLQVAVAEGQGVRWLAPAQFDQIEEWWAMTIHKSQGSEFAHAVVVLPDTGSPILSRELLYTGVTRARSRLTVVADEAAVRAAVARPVARASGLAERLWGIGANRP